MWFDDVEHSKDRDYSIEFPRVKLIKETLFSVNCTTVEGKDEPVLKAEDLITCLTEPGLTRPGSPNIEYNDYLLSKVRTVQK